MANTEQLNVRLDKEAILQLYAISGEIGKPVGTIVREWIMDRLEQEG